MDRASVKGIISAISAEISENKDYKIICSLT